jgi:hypothetical protein
LNSREGLGILRKTGHKIPAIENLAVAGVRPLHTISILFLENKPLSSNNSSNLESNTKQNSHKMQ